MLCSDFGGAEEGVRSCVSVGVDVRKGARRGGSCKGDGDGGHGHRAVGLRACNFLAGYFDGCESSFQSSSIPGSELADGAAAAMVWIGGGSEVLSDEFD